MAMNKAEREAMRALEIRCALAWPQFEEPEPISDAEIEMAPEAFRAWWAMPFRGAGGCVGIGVIDGNSHSQHPYTDEDLRDRYKPGSRGVSMSQGRGGPWYDTKAEALKACIWRRAREFAAELQAFHERLTEDDQ